MEFCPLILALFLTLALYCHLYGALLDISPGRTARTFCCKRSSIWFMWSQARGIYCMLHFLTSLDPHFLFPDLKKGTEHHELASSCMCVMKHWWKGHLRVSNQKHALCSVLCTVDDDYDELRDDGT